MSRQRFDEYAREWVETGPGWTKCGLSRSARDDYRDLLNRSAIPFFGSIRLADVEPQHVKRYAKHLADHGLKPSSVKKALAPMKALFADAVEDGLIRSNPAAVRVAQQEETDERSPQDEKVKALTAEELTALLEELPQWCRRFPAHVRDDALPRRVEREAGLHVPRPRGSRLHASHLRSPSR
jgi:site-specific recombinase XerD